MSVPGCVGVSVAELSGLVSPGVSVAGLSVPGCVGVSVAELPGLDSSGVLVAGLSVSGCSGFLVDGVSTSGWTLVPFLITLV